MRKTIDLPLFIIAVIAVLLWALLCYLGAAFVAAGWNPLQWPRWDRIGFILLILWPIKELIVYGLEPTKPRANGTAQK